MDGADATRIDAQPFEGRGEVRSILRPGRAIGDDTALRAWGEVGGPRWLQRSAASSGPTRAVPTIVREVVQSPGRPLDTETRAFFEPRFGHDLSRVRIHTDPKSVESAWAVRAHAYTIGRDIVFGSGEFSPRSPVGQRLLAHELAHVIQQGAESTRLGTGVTVPGDAHEREAEWVSDAIMRGISIGISRHASPTVARQAGQVREATAAERRDVVYMAAQYLVAMAGQIEALRRVAAAARATTPGSAAAPRAYHQRVNQGILGQLLDKAIAVFEAQRSDNPYINFPAESPEQTSLGEAYARVMEQIGLGLEEARANAANLAPSVKEGEETRYARNHLRWLEANPSAPLAAGVRTTFTRTEVDLSARRHQQASTEFSTLAATVHLYDLSGSGADRLRLALLNASYHLVRDPSSGAIRAERDATLMASIQPILDELDGIKWAITQAVDRLQRAVTRTQAFAADPAANRAVGDTLQAHFATRDPGYARLLADRLARMARELRGEGALTVHARNPQDPECGVGSVGGGLSVTAAHADANRFYFCGTIAVGDDQAVSTVIHETVHAVVPALGARGAVTTSADTPRDRAYAFERIYSRLTTEEALDNAESYSFYVDALLGVKVERPSAPRDSVTGCVDADPVRDAIARATYRIRLGAMWAGQMTGQFHGAAVPQPVIDVIRVGFPGADAARAQQMLTHLRNLASSLDYYLPVVCRPATDPEARAGALVYGPSYRATAGGIAATSAPYPAGTLRICPAWFHAGPAAREDALTSILVIRYRPTVAAADVAGLVLLVRHIQEEAHPSVAARTLQQHQAADIPPAPTP